MSCEVDIELEVVTTVIIEVEAYSAGEGGGAGATEKEYTQVAHGFTVVPTPVHFDAGIWKAADLDSNSTLTLAHIVEIADVDTFTVTIAGFKTLTGHGITPVEEYHYLASGGGYTSVEGEPSDCVMFVKDADSIIFLPYRPQSQAFSQKLSATDAEYSGLYEDEIAHAFSGGGTATINYLAANSGGNCHVITEDTSGVVVITLGNDWPDAHDAVTLKIDPTNLTGLTWTDQASFVNVGSGLDYEACVAFDAGTAQYIIRIEEIGGELFYFESSIL